MKIPSCLRVKMNAYIIQTGIAVTAMEAIQDEAEEQKLILQVCFTKTVSPLHYSSFCCEDFATLLAWYISRLHWQLTCGDSCQIWMIQRIYGILANQKCLKRKSLIATFSFGSFKLPRWSSMVRCFITFHHAWWRHDMETISTLLTLCEGNQPVTKGHEYGALMFPLCYPGWANCWTNSRIAHDLRRHNAHVTSPYWSSVG